MDNRFISFNNSSIFYRICSGKKTVVLLHGFGEDGNIWNDLVDQFKDNFQVIVPDIPGSGKSAMLNNGPAEIFMDDYAEVIIQILKKENITTCTIIGHSMGGYITLAIAEKYPEVINGFGLFHSSAFADEEEKKATRAKSIAFIEETDALTFLKTSIPGLFAGEFQREHADVIENLIASVKYLRSESLIQYQRAMISRPDRIKVLQQASVPVLFIIGEQDQAVPLDRGLRQCHIPSVAFVHILPNTGHMGMLEQNSLCAGIMASYLNSV